MRRIAAFTTGLALLGILASAESIAAQESSVVGAWITASWEGQDGDPAPGLLIFTETNYSMMFVPAGTVRGRFAGETWTDANKVEAVNTLIANSGRYTRSGNQITTEAYVALNQNYMADWGENHRTYTFRVEGDMLYLTWPEGFIGGPDSPGFTGTFRKVG